MALPNKKKTNEHLSEFFNILRLETTYEILDYLNDHGNSHHKNLKQLTSTFTLSHRLNDLLQYTLIEHHFEKEEKRKEWYTITERGRRALELLKRLEVLAERIGDERISQEKSSMYHKIGEGRMISFHSFIIREDSSLGFFDLISIYR